MHILFDYQAFAIQTYGGISKSFCELISHLPQKVFWNLGVCESSNMHLHASNLIPNLPYSSLNKNSFITPRPFRGKQRLYNIINHFFPSFPSEDNRNRQFCINLLEQNKFDIFHPTFFDDYFLPYLGNKPFVLTIHDMMPELFPQYFKRNDFQIVKKKELVKKAAAIIAVSEQTKEDIKRLLKVPEEKITVIYHGGPSITTIKECSIVNAPYFLYVGTREAYKNFYTVLQAYKDFHKSYQNVKLICTGSSFSQKERRKIKELKLQDAVIQLSVNDKELSNLYAHAIAFVYPSLYEGFGMPILEAYAHSCPIILSNCSCFPEIAGNAATYFDAEIGSTDLTKKLQIMFKMDIQQRNNLIEAGKNRLAYFSWTKASQQLMNLYKNILNI